MRSQLQSFNLNYCLSPHFHQRLLCGFCTWTKFFARKDLQIGRALPPSPNRVFPQQFQRQNCDVPFYMDETHKVVWDRLPKKQLSYFCNFQGAKFSEVCLTEQHKLWMRSLKNPLKGFWEKAAPTSQTILLALLKLIPRRRGVLPDLHVGASEGYFYLSQLYLDLL